MKANLRLVPPRLNHCRSPPIPPTQAETNTRHSPRSDQSDAEYPRRNRKCSLFYQTLQRLQDDWFVGNNVLELTFFVCTSAADGDLFGEEYGALVPAVTGLLFGLLFGLHVGVVVGLLLLLCGEFRLMLKLIV